MTMRIALIATTLALTPLAAMAQDKTITVYSWGGSYSKSQVEGYNKPFTARTGITVNMIDSENPALPLKAQAEAGNVTGDVFDVELSDATALCDEGLIIPIDAKDLPPAPDGTPAAEDFVPGALPGCAAANIVFGTVIAYDTTKFPNGAPRTVKDFFDTAAYPGKRGLPKIAKRALYLGLLADGVPADQVYAKLGTSEGVDQALAKLDTIKASTVWWEAGPQPMQLLADGEVTMTTVYMGTVFNAIEKDGKPFGVAWDGTYMDYDLFVIPKGAPHPAEAMDYLKYATSTEALAAQSAWISYGPARKSAAAIATAANAAAATPLPRMPANPAAMTNTVWDDAEFWADRGAELTDRFNAWLAS